MLKNIKYSVVVPVYNSNGSLEILINELKETFLTINKTFEIILVDDYSIDNSWGILTKIKEQADFENITIISLSQNVGQQKATFCGLNYSKGEFIITIDDDLQIHPKEILKLIEKQKTENADAVFGIYDYKNKNIVRKLGSSSVYKISLKNNKQSSFRLFKKELNKQLTFGKYKTNLFINETISWTTGNISYVEVEHNERPYNKTNYSTGKLFNTATKVILFSTDLPLKLIIYSGFTFSILSFISGIYFIYRKLAHNVPLGFTSIIVTILFSTSILLLSLGVIGKYLQEFYIQQNKKPPYLIKKILK